MDSVARFARSSIGRKAMVAAAGLLLCGFLITHLAGNLLLFVGPEAFNAYAKALENNPLIVPAEIGLAALFLVHIAVSLWLKKENRDARPVGYSQYESKGGRSMGSRTMIFSGLLLLAFLVIHINSFKFGDKAAGLFALVADKFSSPPYALFYAAAMAALGLHLSHGVQSAFQTFGVNHPRYTPLIKKAGWGFAALIAGGFAALPLWFCFLR